jgi:UDP:flavonoid glycosyltransferase YjiC (YdhE family)
MKKRVLLAWELGVGHGHILIQSWIAEALRRRGYEPILAVHRLDTLKAFGPSLTETAYFQAPVWPGLIDPRKYWLPGDPVTHADYLAEKGMRDRTAVQYMITAWENLINEVEPDIIVGDSSPACLLAAWGRMPTIATGECFTLPPRNLETFFYAPGNRRLPKYNETELVAEVSAGLHMAGRTQISRLAEIFTADRSCLSAFRELDPYAEFRQEPYVAPWAPVWNWNAPGEGAELFGYFSVPTGIENTLFPALREIARSSIPVRLYVPYLQQEPLEWLAESGISIEPEPLSFDAIQRRSRMVMSIGSLSFASCALVAGLPHLVISSGLSKYQLGAAIERLGVGRSLRLTPGNPLEQALLVQVINDFYRDDRFAETARSIAPDFAGRMLPRPEEVIGDLVDDLIKGA